MSPQQAPATAPPRRQVARQWWLRLHRWLGLGLSLWFVMLGLTGSWLVFYRALDERIDPRLAPRLQATSLPTLESVHQALRQAHPQRSGPWRIELPSAVGEVVTARYNQPVETRGQGFAPLLASVDPVSLQVVANRFWGQHLSTWLFDLHYTLLLGDLGRQLVGGSGVLMLASLASGLWLWWPHPGQWRAALTFKRPASAVRRVYDLHKWAGLLAVPLLGVLALTGAVLALPDLVRPAVAAVSPLSPMPTVPPLTPRPAGTPRLPVDAVVQRAQAAFPGSVARWVDVPADAQAAYRVRLRQLDEPGDRFPDTLLWLDPHTGAVLAQRDPSQFNAGDTLLRWMHPLHSGEALGLAGRALVCACGALPLLLATTGLLRWRSKRRAQLAHHHRVHTAPARREEFVT